DAGPARLADRARLSGDAGLSRRAGTVVQPGPGLSARSGLAPTRRFDQPLIANRPLKDVGEAGKTRLFSTKLPMQLAFQQPTISVEKPGAGPPAPRPCHARAG